MTFNKKEYWKRRNNTVKKKIKDENGEDREIDEKKPLRGQGEYPSKVVNVHKISDAEIGFTNDGNMIIKNRKHRRRRFRLPGHNEYTKKTNNKRK